MDSVTASKSKFSRSNSNKGGSIQNETSSQWRFDPCSGRTNHWPVLIRYERKVDFEATTLFIDSTNLYRKIVHLYYLELSMQVDRWK